MTERLQQRQGELEAPSQEKFVRKVKEMEQERAQAVSHIHEQMEEAAAKEKDIERMQVCGLAYT